MRNGWSKVNWLRTVTSVTGMGWSKLAHRWGSRMARAAMGPMLHKYRWMKRAGAVVSMTGRLCGIVDRTSNAWGRHGHEGTI